MAVGVFEVGGGRKWLGWVGLFVFLDLFFRVFWQFYSFCFCWEGWLVKFFGAPNRIVEKMEGLGLGFWKSGF